MELPSTAEPTAAAMVREIRQAGVRSATATFLLALRMHEYTLGLGRSPTVTLTEQAAEWLRRVQQVRREPDSPLNGHDNVQDLLVKIPRTWRELPLPLPTSMRTALAAPQGHLTIHERQVDKTMPRALQVLAAAEELAYASRFWCAGVGNAGREAEVWLWRLTGTEGQEFLEGEDRKAADQADVEEDAKFFSEASRKGVEGWDWCAWDTDAFDAYLGESKDLVPRPTLRRTTAHWSADERTSDNPPVVMSGWGVTIALLRFLACYPPRDLAFAQRLLAITRRYPPELFVGIERLPVLPRPAQNKILRALRKEADRRADPLSCANLWRLHSLRPPEDEELVEVAREARTPLPAPSADELKALRDLVADGGVPEDEKLTLPFLGYRFQVSRVPNEEVQGKVGGRDRVTLEFMLNARNDAWVRYQRPRQCFSFELHLRELPLDRTKPAGRRSWIATHSTELNIATNESCGRVVRECNGKVVLPKLTGTRMLALHDAVTAAAGAKWAILADLSAVSSCGLDKSLQVWHLVTQGNTWYGSHGYLPMVPEELVGPKAREIEAGLLSYAKPEDIEDFRTRVTRLKREEAEAATAQFEARLQGIFTTGTELFESERAKFSTVREWADEVVARLQKAEDSRQGCPDALAAFRRLQVILALPSRYWIKFF